MSAHRRSRIAVMAVLTVAIGLMLVVAVDRAPASSAPRSAAAVPPCVAPSTAPPSTKAFYETDTARAFRSGDRRLRSLDRRLARARTRGRAAYLWRAISRAHGRTCRALAHLSPPVEVADLHGRMIDALTKLEFYSHGTATALSNQDEEAYRSLLRTIRHQGQRILRIARLFAARGY